MWGGRGARQGLPGDLRTARRARVGQGQAEAGRAASPWCSNACPALPGAVCRALPARPPPPPPAPQEAPAQSMSFSPCCTGCSVTRRHSSWQGRKDIPSFLMAWQSAAQCHLSVVSPLALFPAQEMTHTCARTCTKMYFSIFKKGKVVETLQRGNARTKASLTQRVRLRAGLGRGTRTRQGAAWAQVSRGEGSCWFRKENDATHRRRQTA